MFQLCAVGFEQEKGAVNRIAHGWVLMFANLPFCSPWRACSVSQPVRMPGSDNSPPPIDAHSKVVFCQDAGAPGGTAAGSLLNVEQFHLENQRAVGRNRRTGTVGAVGQIGRNDEFELVAHFHELQPFRPAGDDLI